MNNSKITLDEQILKENYILPQLKNQIEENFNCDGFYEIKQDKYGNTYYILGIYNGLELLLDAFTLKSNIFGKISPQKIGFLQAHEEDRSTLGLGPGLALYVSSLYTTGTKNIGIGSSLLNSALDYARENMQHLNLATLTTLDESLGFYEKMGFLPASSTIDDDCTLMFKDIKSKTKQPQPEELEK